MMRLIVMAFALSSVFAACSGSSEVKERRHRSSYMQQQKADAHMRNEQRRMERENFRQRKKMVKESNKQNRGRWDTNSLGNVFGL